MSKSGNQNNSRQLAAWFRDQSKPQDDLTPLFEVDSDRLAVPRFRFCVGLLFLLSLISISTKWFGGDPVRLPILKILGIQSGLLLFFGLLTFVPQFRKSCYAFSILLAVFVGGSTMALQLRGVLTGFDQMIMTTLFFVVTGFLMPWGGWATASVCLPLYMFYPLGRILNQQMIDDEAFIKDNIYLLFFIGVAMVAAHMNRVMRFKEFSMKKRMESENRVLQDYQVRLKRAYERVENLALMDTLTGAYNRSYFTRWMTNDLYLDKDCQQVFSMIMFDVDGFKTINDLGGHQQGDRILRAVADRVKDITEDRLLFFRYGGDEFCIVFPGLALKDAVRIAERLRDRIHTDPKLVVVLPSRDTIHITISLGVTAEYPRTTVDVDFLIKWVDAALLESKRQGRNCSHVFDPIERKIMSVPSWLALNREI